MVCKGQLWRRKERKDLEREREGEREGGRVTDTSKFLGTMNMYYLVKWS